MSMTFSVNLICTGCGHRQGFEVAAADFEPAVTSGQWSEGMEPSCPACGPLTFDPKRLRMTYQRSMRTMRRQRGYGRKIPLPIRGIPTRLRDTVQN
jgi:hypothetical protein